MRNVEKTILESPSNYQGKLQQPLGSGFDSKSRAEEVMAGMDLTGKNALVTGGYSGIGLETTKSLAAAGARVIVPVRPSERNLAQGVLADIKGVELEKVDLMDLESVRQLASRFVASDRPLHYLINNAGIMFVPIRRNKDGLESQLVTNYLAPFVLTSSLWSALKKAEGARVVNVSSQGHQFGDFNFEDPNYLNREYESLPAYGQSKTAINLFSVELDHRAKEYGVRSYAVHPGNTWGTNLLREAPMKILQQMGFFTEEGEPNSEVINSLKTIPQGAATTLWAATSPLLEEIGGVYLEDSDVAGLAQDRSDGLTSGVKSYSLSKSSAQRLWELSQELTGNTFGTL